MGCDQAIIHGCLSYPMNPQQGMVSNQHPDLAERSALLLNSYCSIYYLNEIGWGVETYQKIHRPRGNTYTSMGTTRHDLKSLGCLKLSHRSSYCLLLVCGGFFCITFQDHLTKDLLHPPAGGCTPILHYTLVHQPKAMQLW